MQHLNSQWRLLGWSALACAALLPACSKSHPATGEARTTDEGAKIGSISQALTLGSGTYEIRNVNSSKCLDVDDWSTLSGGNVQQLTCNAANQANQRYIVTDLGNGEYKIVNEHSGLSLDMEANPCALELFENTSYGLSSTCYAMGEYSSVDAAFNDKASSLKLAPGYTARLYTNSAFGGTMLTKSGPNLATGLDDPDLVDDSFNDVVSSVRVFNNLRQGEYFGQGHQKFKIEDTGSGQYTIKPVSTQTHCVDIAGSSSLDGANVQLWQCNGTNAQKFTFTARSGGATTVNAASLNDQFSYADANAMTASGLYEYRDDTTSGESACRFGPWALGVTSGKLWLRTDNAQVPGDDDYLGDRPCKSGELRTAASYGPYGDIEVRMRANASADTSGNSLNGKTGFMLGLFTGSVSGTPPVTTRGLGLELTGLRLNHMEAMLITNNDPQCTTFHECDGNYRASVSPSSTFNSSAYDGLGQPIFYTFKIEWRWHSIKYYVDGALVHTLVRPNRHTAPWADLSTKLFLSFTVPNHAMENSYGGPWSESDIEEAIDWHEGQVDYLKFSPCSGPGCTLPP